MKVLFIAAPLTARSGVYRSARELVAAGREYGLEWDLFLGLSSQALGASPENDPEWITERTFEPSGFSGISRLRDMIQCIQAAVHYDVIVSLIPQTDMALASLPVPWVAFVRGLPWPDPGESGMIKRKVWQRLERCALKRAVEVWSTTDILKAQLNLSREVHIVPAGIASLERSWDGVGARSQLVWAARYDTDKRPELFVDILRGASLLGAMNGSGPLHESVAVSAPPNVRVGGWVAADQLWTDALAYVGTSSREAFGRSAVEAAMNGIPIIVDQCFGSAKQLITDPGFQEQFIMTSTDPNLWRAAVECLSHDETLRIAYSEHLVENALRLTIHNSMLAVNERIHFIT